MPFFRHHAASAVSLFALLATLACSRAHISDPPDCEGNEEDGDACVGDWSCVESIEGSTGTHFTRRECVDGSVEVTRWSDPVASPDSGPAADAGPAADGGPEDRADAGPDDALCAALCDNGCGTPFGEDEVCVDSCVARALACAPSELAELAECVGLCDSLYPCIADVSCLFEPFRTIPCGAHTCAVGSELCVGCTAWEDGEQRVVTSCEPRGDAEFFSAIWTYTCDDPTMNTNVFIECRTDADCDGDEVCVVTSGEGGYAYCFSPREPDDFEDNRACGGPEDCPSDARPVCVEHTGFGYFEAYDELLGWRPAVCAPPG